MRIFKFFEKKREDSLRGAITYCLLCFQQSFQVMNELLFELNDSLLFKHDQLFLQVLRNVLEIPLFLTSGHLQLKDVKHVKLDNH